MELDESLLATIDGYISDAIAETGTRRAPRTSQSPLLASEPDPDHHPGDLEPQTEPFGDAYADYELGNALVIDERNADGALLAQVSQQLAQSESTLEPLPRTRAARGTVELEDEVTNILARPEPKSL